MDSPKERQLPPHELEEKVREYYDDNTKLFLKLGADARTRSMHQPLFLEPGDSLETAMHAQHKLLLPFLQSNEPLQVLDLGCGVGASMLYLARHTGPACTFTGITISAAQAETAKQAVHLAGLSKRIEAVHGSFLEIPKEIKPADVAYAVESLIHAVNPRRFFAELGRQLKAGGYLIVFDDILQPRTYESTDLAVLRDFRQGWQGYGLRSAAAYARLARCAGLTLTESRDLTGSLRLHRLRDRLVALVVPIARMFRHQSSYCTFLIGGNARQRAYRRGLLSYRMLVFCKNR